MSYKNYQRPEPSFSSHTEIVRYYKANRPADWQRLILTAGFSQKKVNGKWQAALLARDEDSAKALAAALPRLEIDYVIETLH